MKIPQAAATFLSLSFSLSLVVPIEAATYKIRWRLGHRNLDYFEEAARKFKQDVETGSKGDIAVDIVALASDSPSQGPEGPEIAALVAKGEAEMGHSFVDVMGGLDKRLYVFEAPFLFRGYRHLEGVFEGSVGSDLLEGLRSRGIVGLSFTYSGGATGIATTERELRRPEDLKGLKVGGFGDEVEAAWLRSLGATPVAIGHNGESIVPLARKHALDGVLVTWRNFEREMIHTDFSDVNLMNATYLVSVTYINERFFDGLPAAYRALIAKSSREAGRIERARTIELNENAKREMLAKGVRPVYLTQKNQRRFVEALQPAYARSLEPVIGKELIESIRGTPDAPEPASVPVEIASLK